MRGADLCLQLRQLRVVSKKNLLITREAEAREAVAHLPMEFVRLQQDQRRGQKQLWEVSPMVGVWTRPRGPAVVLVPQPLALHVHMKSKTSLEAQSQFLCPLGCSIRHKLEMCHELAKHPTTCNTDAASKVNMQPTTQVASDQQIGYPLATQPGEPLSKRDPFAWISPIDT